jgi:hypothetical protein
MEATVQDLRETIQNNNPFKTLRLTKTKSLEARILCNQTCPKRMPQTPSTNFSKPDIFTESLYLATTYSIV